MAQRTDAEVRVRKDFSKIRVKIGTPNLIEIQKASYERFIQLSAAPDGRDDVGLQSAFTSVFPISDYNDSAMVEFIDYSIGEPKYDVQECLERGMTFSGPLRIRVRLVIWDKEAKGETKVLRDVREQEVYIGELPLMTENGTFLVNGTERVVVSQLQRSPGAAFMHDKGKTHSSGMILFSGRIIPYRGSWLDFDIDAKDILYVRIDRRRKLPASILLKAFMQGEEGEDGRVFSISGKGDRVEGASVNEVILKLFYPIESVSLREGILYRKLDPKIHTGIRVPADITAHSGEQVLVKEGNKLTKGAFRKVSAEGVTEIPYPREELVGKVVLYDVVDEETGEILIEQNDLLTEEIVSELIERKIESLELLFIDNVNSLSVIRDTLTLENVNSPEEAMVEIYRRLRPGETPTMDTAKLLFENLFTSSKRYDLSPVGRLKINKKLGLKLPLTLRTLTEQDVVEVLRYLVDLRAGIGIIEDIDHLGNRRVRSVGELLENQFRIGLVRMERTIKERMNLLDLETVLPHDLINAKPVIAVVKEFFGSSQLSQFMDQTNPLAEITHKRRLSALGPGGLTRDRAGFEVRDVHPSHYGRICPIETPEGPNIGLITSLATYARVNEFGFIESPYHKASDGVVSDEIEFLSAIDQDRPVIAQANTPLADDGTIVAEKVTARSLGDFIVVPPKKVQYMDVSPKQIVSVATSLIPFLEHDDANRALMGSNMQRQAVPLLESEAPLVGTGMEEVVARNSGYIVLARNGGVVENVDGGRIVVRVEGEEEASADAEVAVDVYKLIKFQRSNQNTCINQRPIVSVGMRVKKGDVLADGPAIDHGELALGRNITVAFMPWGGYNFEDAILISEKIVKDDIFTSINIEEFDLESRDTKLGKEDITRDIPNVSEEGLMNLDESGIIRVGAEVKPGHILVGKVTPKGESQLTPEEKLLRAIFGEKAGDVKDASLYVPPGIEGVVVDVKIFSRRSVEKDERSKTIENQDMSRIHRDHKDQLRIIEKEKIKKLRTLMVDMLVGVDIVDPESGEIRLKKKKKITAEILEKIKDESLKHITLSDKKAQASIDQLDMINKEQVDILQTIYDGKVGRLKRGAELPPGVIKLVKVLIAMKRKLQVGDKMAGRHGNKGVVSRILPEEDMPYLPDGTPVEIVLNPLGVPSRMNVGQVLEIHLGWAAHNLGIHISTPVFDSASEDEIKLLLKSANLSDTGQTVLYDGKTGEAFRRPVTVGKMYILKLHHLVDDKIHSRSIGPYSLVTQQPLGGKAQFGGQRLGEMEVWALQAYGAASILQEFLTVKSDDVPGRSRIYEAIVKGEHFLESGLPESFNVLIKELQSLGLDVELIPDLN